MYPITQQSHFKFIWHIRTLLFLIAKGCIKMPQILLFMFPWQLKKKTNTMPLTVISTKVTFYFKKQNKRVHPKPNKMQCRCATG